MDRLTAFLEDRTRRIISARIIAAEIVRGRRMGKLSYLGERLREQKAEADKRADDLLARVDALKPRIDETFARANNVFDIQTKDVTELEAEIQALTNSLPLDER